MLQVQLPMGSCDTENTASVQHREKKGGGNSNKIFKVRLLQQTKKVCQKNYICKFNWINLYANSASLTLPIVDARVCSKLFWNFSISIINTCTITIATYSNFSSKIKVGKAKIELHSLLVSQLVVCYKASKLMIMEVIAACNMPRARVKYYQSFSRHE